MMLTFHGLENIEFLAVGAEAVLLKGYFLGIESVYKVRIPKPYRDPKLDLRLRYERTLAEAKALILARRAGVNVPYTLFIEPDVGVIVMEYLRGCLLREVLNSMTDSEIYRILRSIGVLVGKLHLEGIVHGDLTTSNIIVLHDDKKPYLIDFGLAKVSDDVEDRGVDIHLFLRSLESAHYVVKDKAYKYFIEGYGEIVGEKELSKVISKVKEIRTRGRYVEERRKRH